MAVAVEGEVDVVVRGEHGYMVMGGDSKTFYHQNAFHGSVWNRCNHKTLHGSIFLQTATSNAWSFLSLPVMWGLSKRFCSVFVMGGEATWWWRAVPRLREVTKWWGKGDAPIGHLYIIAVALLFLLVCLESPGVPISTIKRVSPRIPCP